MGCLVQDSIKHPRPNNIYRFLINTYIPIEEYSYSV